MLSLQPNIKLAYCKKMWNEEYYNKEYNALCDMFNLYYKPRELASQSLQSQNSFQGKSAVKSSYASAWIQNSIQPKVNSQMAASNPQKELCDYLESNLEQYHSKQYPTLSWIACNYLAIQGSFVAAEHSFSAGRLTNVLNRNQMDPELFGYLQILKGCYKSKLMTATNEAKAHEPMDWESI
ncbi:hypothetical protein JR316_0010135 [Psilocybe cubensis]|uniref:Uncharacterized protein n=1 Tax=Psilocybe cubensis TaxID=181762 RepID=A0ACB8GQ92_PSICU|nr:hypothetical protein JR316_0010135 [Psilocybe cubensis]KAH9477903.1 hypothetical protein JR316_0010135 [Psilocybe cubensis]